MHDPLFFLISRLVLVSWKVYKIQLIRVAYQKPANLNFYASFKVNIQKRKGLSNFEKPGFDFSVLHPKMSWLSKKLKVSSLEIRIKQSGLKVSHSKISSSVQISLYHHQFWKNKDGRHILGFNDKRLSSGLSTNPGGRCLNLKLF